MAVPSSGELKLWDDLWNQELDGSKGNNSLHSASVYAGFSTPDALGDFYGYSDVEAPTISTQPAQSVTHNSFRARGCVSATGNEDPTRGFYMGTNANASTNNPKYSIPGTGGVGLFCCDFSSLSNQTTYYYWAFGLNSAAEAEGARETVSTPAPPFSPQLVDNFFSGGGTQGNAVAVKCHRTSLQYINPYTSQKVSIWSSPTQCLNSPSTCQNWGPQVPKQGISNAKNVINNYICGWGNTTYNQFQHIGNGNYSSQGAPSGWSSRQLTYILEASPNTRFNVCNCNETGFTGGVANSYAQTIAWNKNGQTRHSNQMIICFCQN